MPHYMMLLRGGDFSDYSEEELERIVQEYIDWSDRLREKGVYLDGNELRDGGRVLRMQDGRILDGPFTETKEAVGGYVAVEADDYDAAQALADDCPHFKYGGTIEIREIVQR